jgi:hypothetical protein
VTEDILADHMPEPSFETFIMFSGPPLFNKLVHGSLLKLGYKQEMLYKF